MAKTLNDIKRDIALLTLDIECLDQGSKYSAIVHLEETIVLLKLGTGHDLVKAKDGDNGNGQQSLESSSLEIPSIKFEQEKTFEMVECKICNVYFPESHLLKKHEEDYQHQASIDSDLISTTCNLCGKQCKSRNNLLDHKMMHMGKYCCPRCKAPFPRRRNLLRHFKNPESCIKLKKIRSLKNYQAETLEQLKAVLPSNNNSTSIISLNTSVTTSTTTYPQGETNDKNKEQVDFLQSSNCCPRCKERFPSRSKLLRHSKNPENCKKLQKISVRNHMLKVISC